MRRVKDGSFLTCWCAAATGRMMLTNSGMCLLAGDIRRYGGSRLDGAEARQAEIRALARDITRCTELEAVLDGRASTCREVAGWQGLTRAARWYVPEPWAGHIGAAAILFVSSNPSAGPREEQFDPARHMSRRDRDEDLFTAADGAFDDPRFPGIASGIYNRDRRGRQVGAAVPFWRWTCGIARELLGREPAPGNDYALTEVVHCGSQRETGVAAALGTCASRYLRRVLAVSPAGVVVVVGATARGVFEGSFGPNSPAACSTRRAVSGSGGAANCSVGPATSSPCRTPTRACPRTAWPGTSGRS